MRADFPLPDVEWPLLREFWSHAANGVLAMPRTTGGEWQWYPKTEDVEWVPVSGRGTVFSWTEVHQVFLPAFADQVPYLTGLVTLDDAPAIRLATRFVDCESITIGDPVEVTFRPMRFSTVDGEVQAPFFRPL
jgi:uncharacterized OB-fold protein